MASDLQRRKVSLVFGAMDADGDGVLTQHDFELLTERWTAKRAGDEAVLSAVMMGWWETLSQAAGNTERVTLENVLAVVDILPQARETVDATAEAMFAVVDENSDDEISRDEYVAMIEAWNGQSADIDFALLDLNSDGTVTRDEFIELWYEFWAGDNASAPGTYVFGPLAA